MYATYSDSHHWKTFRVCQRNGSMKASNIPGPSYGSYVNAFSFPCDVTTGIRPECYGISEKFKRYVINLAI